MSKDLFKLNLTDDGLHLEDSILWFDSHFRGELSFLSSALTKTSTHVPRIIATEETIKILEVCRKKTNALVCQYNRPFSLGPLKMELLPSGGVLGGASLYVETNRGKILYAPSLQPHAIPIVRKMQIKRASTLILGAHLFDPQVSFPNRKKEKERLIMRVEELLAKNQPPVILCDPIGAAQEVTKALTDSGFGVACHPAIHRIHRVYENFGSKLGVYSLLSKRSDTHNKVILYPKSNRNPSGFPGVTRSPLISVEDAATAIHSRVDIHPTFPTRIIDTIYLSTQCDGPEMKAIVSLVSPKELFFFGAFAKKYCQEFEGLVPKVKPLFANDQPTLF